MKSIGLKNFRRFTDLPQLSFGNITFLVGANNAGKSTLYRAIDLLTTNIKKMRVVNEMGSIVGTLCCKFNLSSEGNYSRAHNNTSSEPISFTMGLGNNIFIPSEERFSIRLTLANSDDSTAKTVQIEEIEILDKELFLHLIINKRDYTFSWIELEKSNTSNIEQSLDTLVWHSYNNVRHCNDPEIGYEFTAEYETLMVKRRQAFIKTYQEEGHQTIKIENVGWTDLPETSVYSGIPYLLESVLYAIPMNGSWWNPKESIKYRVQESALKLKDCIEELDTPLLPVHSLEKTVVFLKDHTLFPLIEEFSQTEKDNLWVPSGESSSLRFGKTKREYLIDYLNLFGIATNYIIEDIGGEAYTFKIEDKNGKLVDLADIGSGAIKLIELFLFVLNSKSSLLSISEPEQNLHPMFQSRLADFFLKVNNELGKKFIVETHSEYVIRRSQVLVAELALYKKIASEEELEPVNPFKVYYFPEEGVPYDMIYQINGHFEESFGKGFFDESSKWTRELITKRRR